MGLTGRTSTNLSQVASTPARTIRSKRELIGIFLEARHPLRMAFRETYQLLESPLCSRSQVSWLPIHRLCEPLLESDLGGAFKRLHARLFAELPQRAVQELPHSLGSLLVECGVNLLGTRGVGREGIEALFVELLDSVVRRLLSASQVLCYPR